MIETKRAAERVRELVLLQMTCYWSPCVVHTSRINLMMMMLL